MVTPEDAGLRGHAFFLQGAGVSLPPAAPPQTCPLP